MSVQVKGSGTIGGLDEGLVVSGIVTASTQINVGSNIKVGSAGVVTATTFSGSGASLTNLPAGNLTGTVADARISTLTASKLTGALPAISGANLTGITGTTINNNANNRIITGSGTANTLEGEANLTFDGSSLDVFNGSNSSTIKLKRHASTASEQAHIGYFSSGLHIETRENTYITLKTNTVEKVRITGDGQLCVTGTSTGVDTTPPINGFNTYYENKDL